MTRSIVFLFITLFLHARAEAQPINDDCSGAIDITTEGTYQVDFENASQSTPTTCGFSAIDMWYTFTLMDSMRVFFNSNELGLFYYAIYTGNCEELTIFDCHIDGSPYFPGEAFILPPGQYYLVLGTTSESIYFDFTVRYCPIEVIDLYPIEDVSACEHFILPNIRGEQLTGNEAYYTLSNASGTKYLIGDTIFSDITLYAYDNNGDSPYCSASESFEINIVNGGLIIMANGGPWFDETSWSSGAPPYVCDQVIISNNQSIWIEYLGSEARCKTLEVTPGSEFEVMIGASIYVGN